MRKIDMELYVDRYTLSIDRLKEITEEATIEKSFQDFFQRTALFLLQVDGAYRQVTDGSFAGLPLGEMKQINHSLYDDVLPAKYRHSYANPTYAKEHLVEYGPMLSFLYTELRSGIPYAFEGRLDYLTILNELFLQVYRLFEDDERPAYEQLREIIYWYASDYCDVFLADRLEERLDPDKSFATQIIMAGDLEDDRYLYQYGEYISDDELKTAAHLRSLDDEVIQKMADVYTEGYRMGFVNTGKDLSIKSVVGIYYNLGFEKVVRKAARNFAKMGLHSAFQRASNSVITKSEHRKMGYYGGIANKQYEYDHRFDQGLFMDKRYIERKLDVAKNTFEQNKELAGQYAGPALIETFGEMPFSPVINEDAVSFHQNQRDLNVMFDSKLGQLTNQYIKGEERSFTIVAYPVPEIGEKYSEIFDEIIRINTLDAKLYEQVQQIMIDALDQGDYVHILGKGANKTDLKVKLHPLVNPEKETLFENCVADVNIPVGEVFTSPMLKGTNGVLHVTKVYLEGLQYLDLKLTFEDGMVVDYNCANFDKEEENKEFVLSNVMSHRKTLPLGELAIGTNTTAYVVAQKYGIEDKMPILIAEKMGPHFAIGDTCYSWSEDVKSFNPNGKEVVAKENEISSLRKEDLAKAYFQCHTDITIPYEELEEISVFTREGKKIILLADERFVLAGTEVLNEAFLS